MIPLFEQLDKLTTEHKTKPGEVNLIWYLFWDKGISYNDFAELPIPYILSIIQTHQYVQKQQEKEFKKSQKKGKGTL